MHSLLLMLLLLLCWNLISRMNFAAKFCSVVRFFFFWVCVFAWVLSSELLCIIFFLLGWRVCKSFVRVWNSDLLGGCCSSFFCCQSVCTGLGFELWFLITLCFCGVNWFCQSRTWGAFRARVSSSAASVATLLHFLIAVCAFWEQVSINLPCFESFMHSLSLKSWIDFELLHGSCPGHCC